LVYPVKKKEDTHLLQSCTMSGRGIGCKNCQPPVYAIISNISSDNHLIMYHFCSDTAINMQCENPMKWSMKLLKGNKSC